MRSPLSQFGRATRHGFTLVELLVVIAIIGTLAALLLPAVQSAREAGRRATCLNNQKEIALAVVNYATAKDKLPGAWGNVNVIQAGGTTSISTAFEWPVQIMSHIGRNDIYTAITQPTATLTISASNAPTIALFTCPSAPPASSTAAMRYAANCGMADSISTTSSIPNDWQANGVFFTNGAYSGQALVAQSGVPTVTQTLSYISRYDGISNTIMIGENLDTENWIGEYPAASGATTTEWEIGLLWQATDAPTVPLNRQGGMALSSSTPVNFARPSSMHPQGFLVAMCDGSTKYLNQDIAYNVYGRLMTPRGNTPNSSSGSVVMSYQAPGSASFQSYPSTPWTTPLSETDLNP